MRQESWVHDVALHTLEICSGVGMLGEGLRAGLQYLGIQTRTVCHIEREAYAASVLAARIEEGSLDAAPVWSDLCTFDAGAWRGAVDCIVAGFPCQDISLAGRRAGLDGARSGLFFNILDIADACGAQFLFLENVAGIASATATVVDEAEGTLDERAAARVVGELADRGWDAEWITLSASDVGASHGRARWFCWAWRRVDNTNSNGAQWSGRAQFCADAGREAMDDSKSRSVRVNQHDQRQVTGNGYSSTGTSALLDNPGRMQWRAGHEQDRPGGAEASRYEAHHGIADGGGDVGHADNERAHRCRCGAEQDGCAEFADTGGCVECEFCGYEFPEHLGRYGCPNCEGEGLDAVANTGSPRQQGRELGKTCTGNWGGAQAHGPTSQLCGLFAPGPSDPRWAGIIAAQPWLAPAIDKETESLLRGTPDGLARKLDFDNRAARLRCVGNGVVAAQAGGAAITLLLRAGFMKQKQPPAQQTRAQAAINKEVNQVSA